MDEGAKVYPREHLYALCAMIERRHAHGALAIAGMLCHAGHAERVWRSYLRLFFRFGLGVRFPYLFPFVSEMGRVNPEKPVSHALAIDLLTTAPRDTFVAESAFIVADHLGTPQPAHPEKPLERMVACMHALCTPDSGGQVSTLARECRAGGGCLPSLGPPMVDLLRSWRDISGPWNFGPWKYVAATLCAFLFYRRPCDYSYNTSYIQPLNPEREWPAPLGPTDWPDFCRFPAHRQPTFGWKLWTRRAARSVSERVGSECMPGVSRSSTSIARERMHVTAVTHVPSMLDMCTSELIGYNGNAAMHVLPSRLCVAMPSQTHEGEWITAVRMNSEEEARDIHGSCQRLQNFMRGAESEVRVLPVERRGAFLLVPFFLAGQYRPADEEFFLVALALEPKTGVPVHAASFVTLISGETYWIPFVGHDEDVSTVAGKVPEAAHAMAREINELQFYSLSITATHMGYSRLAASRTETMYICPVSVRTSLPFCRTAIFWAIPSWIPFVTGMRAPPKGAKNSKLLPLSY